MQCFLNTLFVIVSMSTMALAGDGWQSVTPRPTSGYPMGACCIDSMHLIYVGERGLILRTSNGGATWKQGAYCLSTLHGASFVNASTGAVYGDGSEVFFTNDGGLHWRPQNIPTAGGVFNVGFLDPSTAMAVGASGTVSYTTNGGAVWRSGKTGLRQTIRCAAYATRTTAFAVGDTGTFLRTDDGGATWQHVFPLSQTNYTWVHFLNAQNGYAAGNNTTLLHTTDGGANWKPISIDYSSAIAAYTWIKFFNPDSGIIVAFTYSNRYAILTTTDAGATWSGVDDISGKLRADLAPSYSFADLRSGARCVPFEQASIARTVNGAHNWTSYYSAFGGAMFRGLSFPTPATGFAISNGPLYATKDSGRVYSTIDSGKTWTLAPVVATAKLNAITFPDAMHGAAIGASGAIIHTSDGGAHWTRQTSGTTSALNGVAFADSLTGYCVGGWLQVITADSVIPHRVVLKTTNGGDAWQTMLDTTANVLQAVWAFDAVTVLCVGNGGAILRTLDAGIHWSAQASYIDSVDLYAVTFSSHSSGTIVGDFAHILHTVDGGYTWVRQPADIGGLHKLLGVAFATPDLGIAVGTIGTLLVTSDGGANWGQEWIPCLSDFYSVAAPSPTLGIIAGGAGSLPNRPVPTVILRNTAVGEFPRFTKDRVSINFGEVALGDTRTDSIRIVNPGNGELVMESAASTNPMFSVRPGNAVIQPGDTMVFYVNFTPLDIQTQKGAARFEFYAAGSPDSVVITGLGYGGSVFATQNHGLNFGAVHMWHVKRDSFMVYNRGDQTLRVTDMAIDDPVYTLDARTLTLPPGDSSGVHMLFSPDPLRCPDSMLSRQSVIHITHNGVTSPDSVFLDGMAMNRVTNPATIDYGTIALGSSRIDTIWVTQHIAKVISMYIVGGDETQFHPDPHYVAPVGFDTIPILAGFAPLKPGPVSSFIEFRCSTFDTPETVFVRGIGAGPVARLSRQVIDMGNVLVNTSKSDTVMLTNTGNGVLKIANISTSDFVVNASLDSTTLQPGSSCLLHVTFRPPAVGPYSRSIFISSNAVSSPDSLLVIGRSVLTGIGHTDDPPASVMLSNYPNPIAQRGEAGFTLAHEAKARLSICSVLGAEVLCIADGALPAGRTVVPFDTRQLPSGAYQLVLTSGGVRVARSLVVAR